jgi:hypothetical protein
MRKWRFTSGSAVYKEETDFWLEYLGEPQQTGSPVLGVTLHSIWEALDLTRSPMTRRVAAEDRFRTLVWNFTGRSGLLEIDYGTANARSFSGITLRAVSPVEQAGNGLIEYDLAFDYPITAAGGGIQIARTLQFGTKPIAAQNFILVSSQADRTQFKEVFRAAPIRIASGPALKTLKVTAIREAVAGDTDLARRQAIEAEFQAWTDLIGNAGLLYVNGTNRGAHHLRNVTPGDLTLPDALTFDLEFVYGYGA